MCALCRKPVGCGKRNISDRKATCLCEFLSLLGIHNLSMDGWYQTMGIAANRGMKFV